MLATVLGVVASLIAIVGLLPPAVRRVRTLVERHRHRRQARHDSVDRSANIVAIFEANDAVDSLYRVETIGSHALVPVLPLPADTGWEGRLEPEEDHPVLVTNATVRDLPYDRALIRKKQRSGLNLWDGRLLYGTNHGAIDCPLASGICNYYSYVDLGERVLRESRSASGRKPLLGGPLRSFESALRGDAVNRPVALAGAAACVLETGQEGVREIIYQRRSSSVVAGRDRYALVPAFGLEPNFCGEGGGNDSSRYGVLVFNALKEILEEIFGVRHDDDRHPDTIFESDEGRKLVEQLEQGRLDVHCTGASIDLTDGSLVFAVLIHFRSLEYCRHLRRKMAQEHHEWNDLHATLLGGDTIRELMDEPASWVGTSLYALDRARLHFGISD